MKRITKENDLYYIEKRTWFFGYAWHKITEEELELNGMFTSLIKIPISFKTLEDAREFLNPQQKEIIEICKETT